MTLPRLSTRALAAAAATTAALALAACSSPRATVTPSSGTGSAASPSPSPRLFSGLGFTTDVPGGWSDETSNQSAVAGVSGDGTVLMLLVAPDGGHIDVRTTPQPVADDQLAQYLQSVSQDGATGVSPAAPVNVAGVSGVVITYVLTSSGASFKDEDMVVNHGGDTYDIVLNTPAADFGADLPALQAVLDSWRWT